MVQRCFERSDGNERTHFRHQNNLKVESQLLPVGQCSLHALITHGVIKGKKMN